MAENNIERFNQLTGLVFSALYGSFPIAIDIEIMDFSSALNFGKELHADDKYNPGEPHDFYLGTVEWLIESGYIVQRRKSAYAYMFEGCTLTAKALEILKATPSSISGESIGSQLQEAAKNGTVEAIKSLTSEALSKGIGLVTAAAMQIATS